MNWYLKVLKQYVDFSGRARRTEYWMFVLFNIIVSGIAYVLDYALGFVGVISGLYSLAILLPSLAVVVRRLHDVGKGGGWIFISCVPVIGWVWLLVLLFTDSEVDDNRFGPNPKA
jgi:uncharacterized membrane protein YhaH (DUF805 family)